MTTTSPSDELTPLMKQYYDLKAQVPDALLLFRMGDFYELFGEDAIVASRILEITLTSRDRNKPNPMPMAGVPHHSVQGYIQRLLKEGKKVAIGEQMEDPATVKGPKAIVRRDITRVFTPAVQFDQEGAEAAYLAVALRCGQKDEDSWILACLDPSTGEALLSTPLTNEGLNQELLSLRILHVLRIGGELPEEVIQNVSHGKGVLLEDLPSNYLSLDQARQILQVHYGVQNLDAFIADESGTRDTGTRALGILVTYSARSQRQDRLAHLQLPRPLHKPHTLVLGPRAPQHLDLIPGPDNGPNIYDLVNKTRSALGARQLKRWLLEPLSNSAEIERRQKMIRELSDNRDSLEKLSSELSELYDLERISGRLNAKLANPRDTLALGRSLAILPRLASRLEQMQSAGLQELRESLKKSAERLSDLSERILRTQREDAPLTQRDGGIFAPGTSPELDRLLTLTENGQRWLIELEAREREATGIPTLKVRYNRVFGYYIEVTQAHLKNVPSHYQRKQTTVGAERFFTEELKSFEDDIINASAKQKALEQQLFEELIAAAQALTPPTMLAAKVLGELDALLSLARLALEPGWVFPAIDDSLDLEIAAGRHPLVDAATRGSFVPNDTQLYPGKRFSLLITGPNMGGKSTVMRQVALIVLLGQVGAPVPASGARWGAVSSLYTRIGAHDAISRGQSTFMVEMSELAHILHHANERSLIVLDEIGRGTSTYDGISVAWAALEWISTRVRARTLFATHYHELTRLAGVLPGVANSHMAVEGTRALQGGNLRFLYKLREGPANESFGIHVARLAGVPASVIERAWQVLGNLEGEAVTQEPVLEPAAIEAPPPAAAAPVQVTLGANQLSLFTGGNAQPEPLALAVPHPVIEDLRGLDLDDMTPLQALNTLSKLQKRVKKLEQS